MLNAAFLSALSLCPHLHVNQFFVLFPVLPQAEHVFEVFHSDIFISGTPFSFVLYSKNWVSL